MNSRTLDMLILLVRLGLAPKGIRDFNLRLFSVADLERYIENYENKIILHIR